MTKLADNPPAFPQSSWTFQAGDGREGMTLRDYFAGQALTGLLADRPAVSYTDDIAKKAYAYSDAMLRAREAKR